MEEYTESFQQNPPKPSTYKNLIGTEGEGKFLVYDVFCRIVLFVDLRQKWNAAKRTVFCRLCACLLQPGFGTTCDGISQKPAKHPLHFAVFRSILSKGSRNLQNLHNLVCDLSARDLRNTLRIAGFRFSSPKKTNLQNTCAKTSAKAFPPTPPRPAPHMQANFCENNYLGGTNPKHETVRPELVESLPHRPQEVWVCGLGFSVFHWSFFSALSRD